MIEPRALENIQHVVHIELRQAVRQHRTGQVRMAVMMEVLPRQHSVHIRITARAQ
ncbi:hypothetical protein D3C78_1786860 [compost metagenome]